MEPWKIKHRQTVVQDQWVTLYADECELPNGQTIAPYYVMAEKEWVHVVAVDADGRILLVRQYRHAAGMVCSEFPSGIAEEGEAMVEAAKRELREETGYQAEEWKEIATFHANPARQTNRVHCFLARGLKQVGAPSLDASEEITFAFAAPEEIVRQIGTGEFAQGLHIATYFLAAEVLKQLLA